MGDKKKSNEAITVTATWEKSSKRYERYSVGGNEAGIVGTIYLPKDKKPVDKMSISFAHKEN